MDKRVTIDELRERIKEELTTIDALQSAHAAELSKLALENVALAAQAKLIRDIPRTEASVDGDLAVAQRTIAELTRERDEARAELEPLQTRVRFQDASAKFWAGRADEARAERDAALKALHSELDDRCTCAAIQAADATRHFRECPMREVYPEPAQQPQDVGGPSTAGLPASLPVRGPGETGFTWRAIDALRALVAITDPGFARSVAVAVIAEYDATNSMTTTLRAKENEDGEEESEAEEACASERAAFTPEQGCR